MGKCFIFLVSSLMFTGLYAGCEEVQNHDARTTPQAAAPPASVLSPEIVVTDIIWHDGQSGIINEKYAFSLAKLVAPKTGRVGDVAGSKCNKEREKGLELKKSFEKMEPKHLNVHKVLGYDSEGRAMIYLKYKGTDVGLIGLRTNLLAEWPRRGQDSKTHEDKPDWCGSDEIILDRNPDYQWYCFTRLNRAYDAERKTGVFKISDEYCLNYKPIHEAVCLQKNDLTKEEKFKCGLRIPPHDFSQLHDMMARLERSQ